ncbi:DUF397 domain-containing protein [Streptomyces albogriseolus]|uniref:DUF397 domain-containing protein n=1 Tax=Streptomyces TaxID=1883 RepID=UPI00368D6453
MGVGHAPIVSGARPDVTAAAPPARSSRVRRPYAARRTPGSRAATPATDRARSPPGGECLEVAASLTSVHVRDSKDTGRGTFTVHPAAWSAFVAHARHAH